MKNPGIQKSACREDYYTRAPKRRAQLFFDCAWAAQRTICSANRTNRCPTLNVQFFSPTKIDNSFWGLRRCISAFTLSHYFWHNYGSTVNAARFSAAHSVEGNAQHAKKYRKCMEKCFHHRNILSFSRGCSLMIKQDICWIYQPNFSTMRIVHLRRLAFQ